METAYLQAGQVMVPDAPMALQAVLGPAVVVCVWDKARARGGMAHFALPRPENGERPTSRHGSVAVPLLVRRLEENGSQRGDLLAKVFGGADRRRLFGRRSRLGEANAREAMERLRELGVAVIAEDLGGRRGRRLVYFTRENRVKLLRTMRIREADWRLEARKD